MIKAPAEKKKEVPVKPIAKTQVRTYTDTSSSGIEDSNKDLPRTW